MPPERPHRAQLSTDCQAVGCIYALKIRHRRENETVSAFVEDYAFKWSNLPDVPAIDAIYHLAEVLPEEWRGWARQQYIPFIMDEIEKVPGRGGLFGFVRKIIKMERRNGLPPKKLYTRYLPVPRHVRRTLDGGDTPCKCKPEVRRLYKEPKEGDEIEGWMTDEFDG